MNLNRQEHTLNRLLENDDFVDWVLNPTEVSDRIWKKWLLENPDQQDTLDAAKKLIKNIYTAEEQLTPNSSINEDWERIKEQTILEQQPLSKVKMFRYNLLKYAAVFALLSIATFLLFPKKNQNTLIVESASESTKWILKENVSGITETIYLADGSKILLEPYSSLKYPERFIDKRRDVFLNGEAFFDVEKDSLKPFMIYTKETITKVLGTKFAIKAFDGENDEEVIVKSGKVAVFAQVATENEQQKAKKLKVKADKDIYMPHPNKKLEITANQKIIFNKEKKELVKTVIAKPIIVNQPNKQTRTLKFDETPIEKVFESLEYTYGIKINFDKELLKGCVINTAVTDVPMLEKIGMICDVLSLNYTEKDGELYIDGLGCL